MKPSYLNVYLRILIAIIGGALMIFAAESEPPTEVIKDENFFKNFGLAIISVCLVIEVQRKMIRWLDKQMPFRRRSKIYYTKRYVSQILCSAVPGLVVAVISAGAIMKLFFKVNIFETQYFTYDIYLVILALTLYQLWMGFIHYAWTKDQIEEAIVIQEEAIIIRKNVAWKQALLKDPRYYRIVAILHSLEETGEEQEEESLLMESPLYLDKGRMPLLLEMSNKSKMYMKTVNNLVWEECAAFISMEEVCYAVDWQGELTVINCTIEMLGRFADNELYFKAGRHLIVHRSTIVDVTGIGNGQVKLSLQPAVPVVTILSRERTRVFRNWYRVS